MGWTNHKTIPVDSNFTNFVLTDANTLKDKGTTTQTPTNGAALQSPRIADNVTFGVHDGSNWIQAHTRYATRATGAIPAGWPSAAKFVPIALKSKTYQRVKFRMRADQGAGFKWVILWWPVVDGWATAKVNEGNEPDFIERYNYPGGFSATDGASNLHYRGTDGIRKDGTFGPRYFKKTIKLNTDLTVIHTWQLDWTPNYLSVSVDGNTLPGYPTTQDFLIPHMPMYFSVQTALLGTRGGINGVGGLTGRPDCKVEIADIETWDYTSGTSDPPGDPTAVSSILITPDRIRTTWTPGTPGSSPIAHALLEYQPVGAPSNSWTQQIVTGASNFLTAHLPASTYHTRVTMVDTQGRTSNTVSSNDIVVPVTPPPATVTAHISTTTPSITVGDVASFTPSADGTITSAIFDPGNGEDPVSLPLPLAPFNYPDATLFPDASGYITPSGPNGYQPTLTVSDASSNSDIDQTQIVVNATQGGLFSPNANIPYPLNDQLYDMSILINIVDNLFAVALTSTDVLQTGSDVLWAPTVAGKQYPQFVLTAAPNFYVGPDGQRGDVDPLQYTPMWGVDASTPNTPPPTTTPSNVYDICRADADPSTGGTARSVVLPDGIPDGSFAIIACEIENGASTTVTPTITGGLSLTGSGNFHDTCSNGNGNATLHVFGFPVDHTYSGATYTLTQSSSGLMGIGGTIHRDTTGLKTGHAAVANASTAQTSHPVPVTSPTFDTTLVPQRVVHINGCRFATQFPNTINAPTASAVTQEWMDSTQVPTGQTTHKNQALVYYDELISAAGPIPARSANTNGNGAFSNGWTGVLIHP